MRQLALVGLVLMACRGERAPRERVTGRLGLGRPATSADIVALDDDVRPDGTGLPAGRGTVAAGAATYAERCAPCHGATGREGPYDVLVGDGTPLGWRLGRRGKGVTPATVGNLFPYATTLYDYIHRAMPWAQPGSLTPDETYSVVAWMLHQNGIVPADAALDQASLPQVAMPARGRLVEARR
jgi:S-disulfanyl-L-cysteine oxidoreductase SoxD